MLGSFLICIVGWLFINDNVKRWVSGSLVVEPTKRLRLAGSAKRLIAYLTLDALGFWVLVLQDYTKLDLYYAAEMALYTLLLVQLPFEPTMKDRNQMLVHHIITLFLIATSYAEANLKRLGAAIMLLHDLSDPLLEVAKIGNYLGWDQLAQVAFACFAVMFVWTRLWIFPRHVVYEFWRLESEYPWYTLSMVCLLMLTAMHVYWTSLIIKTLHKSLSTGEKRDVREVRI